MTKINDLDNYVENYAKIIGKFIEVAEINRTAQYEIDRLDVTNMISKKGVIINNC